MVDKRAVFLDLRRDRYCTLGGAAALSFEKLRCIPGGFASEELAEPLLATGMFAKASEATDHSPPRLPAPEPTFSNEQVQPRIADLAEILLLLVRTRRALRSQPFEQLIAKRFGRASGRVSGRPDVALALARRFNSARTLIPIAPMCLEDSLALHDWLARRSVFPMLAVGVKLDPFAAHCWLQLDRIVLNDSPDRVAAFTPILAIE
jgi:hypothetical protein